MEGYISEIRGWAPNWAPRNWALCNGQLLPISQNNALFALIGTIYGGDGRTTFALPDFRGRVMIGSGQGPGLQPYTIGSKAGQEGVTLNTLEIPSHTHAATFTGGTSSPVMASSANATQDKPTTGSSIAAPGTGNGRNFNNTLGFNTTTPDVQLAGGGTSSGTVTIGNTGQSQAHENRQPYLACHYIICLQGIFPSRS